MQQVRELWKGLELGATHLMALCQGRGGQVYRRVPSGLLDHQAPGP